MFPTPEIPTLPLWKRLAWMAAIWTVSVTALGLVGLTIRLWLK